MQFRDVIGQDAVKQRLIRSVNENRISHAQLFLGPEGSGNLALALAYAAYVLCENRSDTDSCGTCPSCLKVKKLVHPDLHFSFPVNTNTDVTSKPVSLDFIARWRQAVLENSYINLASWLAFLGIENKQGIISVEESNAIIKSLSLKTVESAYKIMIIWMPEKLNTEAGNKLLKIIEEPPDKTLFILVAEDYEGLLGTIVSRTQLIKIKKLTDEEIRTVLTGKHALSASEAARIAHLSDGNYFEAQQYIGSEENDSAYTEQFLAWMRLCFTGKTEEIIRWVDEMAKSGRERQKNFIRYSLQLVRECILINYGDSRQIRLEETDFNALGRFAPFVNMNSSQRIAERLNESHFHIERNANPKPVFLDLSLTMGTLLHGKG